MITGLADAPCGQDSAIHNLGNAWPVGPPPSHCVSKKAGQINGRLAFEVAGQTAILFEDADYEDDAVGPLSSYPLSIAIVTGTNREMEASTLRAQKVLAGFDTLALRNLSTRLPSDATAAA